MKSLSLALLLILSGCSAAMAESVKIATSPSPMETDEYLWVKPMSMPISTSNLFEYLETSETWPICGGDFCWAGYIKWRKVPYKIEWGFYESWRPGNPRIELGLRYDGMVVWRKKP